MPPRRTARRRFIPVAALALAAVAALPSCAHAPKAGAAKEADEPLPPDVEGTLALLDRAEAELSYAIGPVAGGGAAAPLPSEAPTPAPAADAPVAQSAPPEPEAKKAEAAEEEDQGSPARRDPCDTACRALASMRRAAEHLCGLAGEQDGRCSAARDRVRGADERVRTACPRCAS